MTEDINPEYGRMSDEAVATLRSRIGRVYPIEDPYIRSVNADNIRHYARGVGDMNPLFVDPDYAKGSSFGRLVAPPGFLSGVGWGSWDLRRGQGLPGVHGLHSGDTWTYYRPLLEGDEVHATKELVKADFKEGRAASKMLLQVSELRYYNQREELVAVQLYPAFRLERHDSKGTGKNAAVQLAMYSPEEIAQIDAELEAEQPRGPETRYWEDVSVGEDAGSVVKGPLTVPDMIAWLQGIGSPHVRSGKYWLEYRKRSPKVAITDPATGIPQAVERVHWDHFMAAEIGMPAPYDYGSQRGGYANYWASLWCGDDGWVAHMDYQYRGMVFMGDVYRIRGKVVDKWRGAKTGTAYVKAEFTSVNQRGEDIMPGNVTWALPSRETGAVSFPVDVLEDGRA